MIATTGATGRQGFTLIELLVVVAIIALLISILLPSLQGARDRAKAAVCGANLRQMGVALELYLDHNEGFYPGEHSLKGNTAFIVWAPRVRLYAAMQEKIFWCPAADNKSHWKVVMGAELVPRYVLGYGYQLGEKPLRSGDNGDLFCYGYNSWGVAEVINPVTGVCLGLGANVDDPNWPEAWSVRVEHIVQPSDMIALADSQADGVWDSAIDPENWQDHEWPSARHYGGAEVMFCDGHATYMKQKALVEPVEWMRRRWNNDYLPHKDVWQD
ncbi:MAG: prepilin-type N-terminal cleavage/methylation domain-containing protein [Phycisphaerae bacterium]